MAAGIVKCKYCGKELKKDSPACMQISERRYAHVTCHADHAARQTKEETDREILENYIKDLFHEKVINPKIKRQIESYRKAYGYSYPGIYWTLQYAFTIKNNDIKKSNGGIGIVPYLYNEARDYYNGLQLAKERNADKNIKDYILETKEVTITSPERKPMKKIRFSFLDMEDEDAK